MVHFQAVAEFVDDDIVDDIRGCHHEEAVEVQVAFCGAGAPAGFLVSDGDASVGYVEAFCIVGYAFRDVVDGLVAEFLYFFVCEGWE